MPGKQKARERGVIIADIAQLLPAEARLKELRDELNRADSRERLARMNGDPAMRAAQVAGLSRAMMGNQNSLGTKRSAEWRAAASLRMMGNTNSGGRKDSPETLARKAAPAARKRGVPVIPSPAPGILGLSADYAADRVVFYVPAHEASP